MRRTIRLGFAALVFPALLGAAVAADRKMEARLIWGTNDDKSPDPKHKPLDGELAKKHHDERASYCVTPYLSVIYCCKLLCYTVP